jgi:hypothetical protein
MRRANYMTWLRTTAGSRGVAAAGGTAWRAFGKSCARVAKPGDSSEDSSCAAAKRHLGFERPSATTPARSAPSPAPFRADRPTGGRESMPLGNCAGLHRSFHGPRKSSRSAGRSATAHRDCRQWVILKSREAPAMPKHHKLPSSQAATRLALTAPAGGGILRHLPTRPLKRSNSVSPDHRGGRSNRVPGARQWNRKRSKRFSTCIRVPSREISL